MEGTLSQFEGLHHSFKTLRMKKLTFLSLFLMILIVLSCSKDDEPIEPKEPEPPIETDTIEDPDPDTEEFVLKPQETRRYMVDQAATDETVALFYNLKTLSKTNVVIGQQDAFNAFYNDNAGASDMKKTTGSDPGMLGSDFMFITDDNNNGQPNNWFYQQEQIIVEDAIEAYNKGMINAFTWHLREPYEGEVFYTSEMTEFQKANAFRSILPGGANHEYYKKKLQKIAEVAKSIKGSDGTLSPIIFRPFHEFDKDFFWWGAAYSSPAEFKELWRFTVTYLRDELDVHNLLYAFAPDNSYTSKSAYLSRYPGDGYVDILGMDNYGDLSAQDGSGISIANQKLKVVSDLAIEKVKIAALTETGFFADTQNPLPQNFYSEKLNQVITGNEVEIGFMMFWQNNTDSYTVPPPGMPGEADFIEFVEQEEILLLKDMPNMYSLPE